jgi:tetratricopeptide (TPR) repeat protein
LQRAETGEGFTLHRMTAAALRAVQDRRSDMRAARAAVELLAAVYPADALAPGNWPLCARLTPHSLTLWEVLEPKLDSATSTAPGGAALEFVLNQSAIYLSMLHESSELALAQAGQALKEARLQPDHRDMAVGLANLAVAHLRQGEFDTAEALLDRAITLNRTHRPDSVDLADSLNMLGGLWIERARQGEGGDLELAAEAFEEALLHYRAQLGENHDNVAMALNNLSVLRAMQGRGTQAADLAGQALVIRRKVLPSGDARLAIPLVNTAGLALKAGQAPQAEPLLQEAYDSLADVLKPDHPDLRRAADWLTLCWLVLAQQPGARGLYEAKAKTLCAKHGLDFARQQAQADALIKQDAS